VMLKSQMRSAMRRRELAHERQKINLANPSPQKAGCAVGTEISPISANSEFFNTIRSEPPLAACGTSDCFRVRCEIHADRVKTRSELMFTAASVGMISKLNAAHIGPHGRTRQPLSVVLGGKIEKLGRLAHITLSTRGSTPQRQRCLERGGGCMPMPLG
jgi:hypothetical protein